MVPFRSVVTLAVIAAGHAACAGYPAPGTSTPSVAKNPAGVTAPGKDSLRSGDSTANLKTHRSLIPGDLIEVQVFDAPELTRIVRVSDAGDISLPLLGAIQVTGKTARQLEITVQDKLRGTYMIDPRVTIEVKEAAAQPIYVLGEVNQPGAFTPSGAEGLTILQAVAVARGLKTTAHHRRAVIIRYRADAEPLQIPVNISAVVSGHAPDLVLQPSDVIYVHKNSEKAVALGVIDAMLKAVTFKAVF